MNNTRNLGIRITLLVALAAVLFPLFGLGKVQAAVPTGYSEYYIPAGEQQLWDILNNMDSYNLNASYGMHAVISVVASQEATTIYYDHWENGYGFDPANPDTSADEVVILNEGEVRVFESSYIPINPRGTGLSVCGSYPAGSGSNTCYDGRDRIFTAGGAVTVNRAGWTDSPNVSTLYALAWEVYPTKPFMTHYTVPVGEDMYASGYTDFYRTYVMVQSTVDGTTVQIDDPRTPGAEVSTTLDRGEVTQLHHIGAGTQVNASDPVQVQFIVGTDGLRGHYELRGYTAVPQDLWNHEYYVPVGGFADYNPGDQDTHNDSDVYIYNPSATDALTINWEDSSGSGDFSIPAASTRSYSDGTGHVLPAGSGAYLNGSLAFWGIGSVDAESPDYDWGYSLIPSIYLQSDYTIGWAPGTLDRDANGSPLFITAGEDGTIVFVDYSPVDGIVDAQYTIDRLEVLTIYDADHDMTGSHVWATHPIAIVWGEDPDNAQPGFNYLDLGYTALPFQAEFLDLVLTVEKTVDPIVLPAYSVQTATFSLVVSSSGYSVDDVVVADTLPAGWTYQSGTTHIVLPDSSTSTVEPDISGQDLTWDSDVLGGMNPDEIITITFDAYTTDTFAPGDVTWNWVRVTGTRTVGGSTQTFTASDSAYNTFTDLRVQKVSDIGDGPLAPGDTITYTIVAANPETSNSSTRIVVNDPLPTGTSYVAGSTQVTEPSGGTYLDRFDTAAYDNSDGSLDWSASGWAENDGGGGGATGGAIRITGGELRIQDGVYGYPSIRRTADLSDYTGGILTFVHHTSNTLEGSGYGVDQLVLEVAPTASGPWTVLQTFSGISAGSNMYSIPLSCISANTTVRFRVTAGFSQSDEFFYVDNLQIEPTPSGEATNSGGAPPDLVTAADGYNLLPGQSMTVTFQVTVNDSLPSDLTGIANTACVSSYELPGYVCDTIVDPIERGAIGNYVWLDENGDGVQDAGEAGIPNAVVELRSSSGALLATTTTDADGGYLFDDLPLGVYTVVIQTGSLPGGLAANPTYDEDSGTTSPDHQTVVSLSSGEEHLTADFGYNWSSPAETDDPGVGATGAIGDRVWIDADGDGVQDSSEAGLSGVTVRLYTDPDGDGVYDNVAGTATTDAAGNYIFDNLVAGAYVVRVDDTTLPSGYIQTGDPDYFGATLPAGEDDNQTTTPIILAPGDVFVNADFGYQPAISYAIGDTIWLDADADGVQDATEPGIPGVTVALLDDSGDVIATTVTSDAGTYLFAGLPNGAYTVWVNDTHNVLGELTLVSEPSGGNDDGTSNLTLSGSDNLAQDFGYAPPGHSNGRGLIGDTIFLDYNGNGSPDPGEGLEGVTVMLTDGDGDTMTTTTDENGNYSFGDLDPNDTYTVDIDTTALPNGGIGLTNSVDPDGGGDSTSVVDLSSDPDGIDLDQDFGYVVDTSNTISGTIWEDADADGTLVGGELGRFEDVTVVLYDGSGNVVATTKTDSSGDYSFTGLADGTYTVDVTDAGSVLNGYWHSDGPNDGNDNNSQDDPYSVTVGPANRNDATADFGYYVQPASVGNYVWLDLNEDGVQDDDKEPGIKHVTVVMTITYPNGVVVTATTVTGKGGIYGFGNLLLDEDYGTGDNGGGTPNYEIGVPLPTGTTRTPENAPGPDDEIDGDSDGASEIATVVQGESDPSYDFGLFGDVDLGDLPDDIGGSPDYPTWFRPGPANIVFPDGGGQVPNTTGGVPAVWLGARVDTETDGQPSIDANGDGADEDGVAFAPANAWTPGGSPDVTITLNGSESGVTVYFGLWIDWNADGDFDDDDDGFYTGSDVTGSPVDVPITVDVPASYVQGDLVYFRVRAADWPLTFEDYEGTFINGEVEDYLRDFDPTAVTLASFTAEWDSGQVLIAWETTLEIDTIGFNLWRSTASDGAYVRVNETLIPAASPGGVMGGVYTFDDPSAVPGTTYYYKLEELEVGGARNWYGPAQTGGSNNPTATTLSKVDANGHTSFGWWLLTLPLAVGIGAMVLTKLWKRWQCS